MNTETLELSLRGSSGKVQETGGSCLNSTCKVRNKELPEQDRSGVTTDMNMALYLLC